MRGTVDNELREKLARWSGTSVARLGAGSPSPDPDVPGAATGAAPLSDDAALPGDAAPDTGAAPADAAPPAPEPAPDVGSASAAEGSVPDAVPDAGAVPADAAPPAPAPDAASGANRPCASEALEPGAEDPAAGAAGFGAEAGGAPETAATPAREDAPAAGGTFETPAVPDCETAASTPAPPDPASGLRRGAAFRRALLAVAGLALGLGLYTANAELVGNDRMPMPFGVGVAVVLSGSMEPALHVNDVVVVRRAQDVEVGDVVVYQSRGSLVVHRVVAAGGGEVVTRGDANGADDAPIERGQVKGVVAFSVPAVGWLVRALQSPVGLAAVLALVVFLVERSYSSGRRAHERELAELAAEIRRLRDGPPPPGADARADEGADRPPGNEGNETRG